MLSHLHSLLFMVSPSHSLSRSLSPSCSFPFHTLSSSWSASFTSSLFTILLHALSLLHSLLFTISLPFILSSSQSLSHSYSLISIVSFILSLPFSFMQPKFIALCIDEIKVELRQDNIGVKANAVCKLMFVSVG